MGKPYARSIRGTNKRASYTHINRFSTRTDAVTAAKSLSPKLPDQFSYLDVANVMADTKLDIKDETSEKILARAITQVNALLHYGCVKIVGSKDRNPQFEFNPGEYE